MVRPIRSVDSIWNDFRDFSLFGISVFSIIPMEIRHWLNWMRNKTYTSWISRDHFSDDNIRNCLITLHFKIVSTQHCMNTLADMNVSVDVSWFFFEILLQMHISYFGILISNSSYRWQLNNNFEMIVIVIRCCYRNALHTTHHQCQQ